ncbi:putative pyridoxal-dependent aspartate 1-decarboxylase [Cyanosarcina cf. burmensis CCALA 770]|nr:putative pyridoxal-dependent aspartate 1-decarboxylase [Cyanosarcina cf. burmensis CCALA 770]
MIRSLNLENSAIAESEIQNRILSLFARSDKAIAAERDMDGYLEAIANEFLQTTKIGSDIALTDLNEQFTDYQIPIDPVDPDDYLNELTETAVAHSVRTSSPRFIGHMTTALPYFVRPLAKLMTILNQNPVKTETAKSLTPYERQALATLHHLIYQLPDAFYIEHTHNPHSTLGMIVSGGTIANITALWCARNAALAPQADFMGVEQEGLAAALKFYGYDGAVVIGSSLMHFSFDKAADLLGIGTRSLIKIPANEKNQVDLRSLRQTIRDCRDRKQLILAIVGIAGTTDSGGIDPLLDMAEIAKNANIHFHVDAAWGGPMLFSQRHRYKLQGIEFADSVTIDGHKQLYLPMGIGMLFLHNPNLAKAIEKQAPYTVRQNSIDLGKRTLEGSRPATAILLQAGLKLIGMKGYEYLMDWGIEKTWYLATRIEAMPEFERLIDPEINIFLYRYIPEPYRHRAAIGQLTLAENQSINQFNQHLQKAQRQAGHTFISRTTTYTTRYGKNVPIIALRAVIANPLTTELDINAVIQDQLQIAADLSDNTSGSFLTQ